MKELNQCILETLDGINIKLFPYLPYILQDLFEIGANPAIMLSLIDENIKKDNLKILDLGCGKGAVSINIAKSLNCNVKGIDGMPEFIESANKHAIEHHVNDICEFEVGDIRTKINDLKDFDIVILGAIGPVFGNLYETLNKLKNVLKPNGYILLDDGYIEDSLSVNYNNCMRKSGFYNHILSAGFEVVQEVIGNQNKIKDSNKFMYKSIEKRVNELIIQYPEKKYLFSSYIKKQKYENDMLENVLVTGTWLLKRKK